MRPRRPALLLLLMLPLAACTATQISAPPRVASLMGSASDAWTSRVPAPAEFSPSPKELRPRVQVAVPEPGACPHPASLRWSAVVPDVPLPRLPAARSRLGAPLAPQTWNGPADLHDSFERYGFPVQVEAPQPGSPDPLGDAFVGNWAEKHIPPDRFAPLTGSLDLSAIRNGSIYGRAWSLDQDLRGLGVGVAWRLHRAWQLAAEVGVNPFTTLEEGRVAFLFGFSREL